MDSAFTQVSCHGLVPGASEPTTGPPEPGPPAPHFPARVKMPAAQTSIVLRKWQRLFIQSKMCEHPA